MLVPAPFVDDYAESVSQRLAIGVVRCPEGGEGGEKEEQGNGGAGFFFFLDLWIPTQS